MTASRRSRRHPPLSAPEERLRTLGLDASPTARRLRARIPRAPSEPGPGAALPRAPYAVEETATPYRPEPRRPTPAELWGSPSTAGQARPSAQEEPQAPVSEAPPPEDLAPEDLDPEVAPTVRLRPAARAALPEPESPPPQSPGKEAPWQETPWQESPWKEPPRSEAGRRGRADHRSAALPDHGSGADSDPPPPKEPEESSGGRHRRRSETVRPPSGYTELDPEAPDSVLDRAAERWGPRTSLSRRAVVALLVLGLLAVAGTFLVLRERPGEVTVPELVSQAAPASQDPSDPAGGQGAGGAAPDGAGEGADASGGDVVVHVGGEVAEPGLYTMPAGSRVADAVEEAGGPLPEADLDLVNLARTLTDGERILVGVPQPEGGPGDGPAGSGSPVDLNLAGQTELETLPGIGQKKAQQILAHREALGGSFSSVEDLLEVDGIAEKTFRNLEPLVTVG